MPTTNGQNTGKRQSVMIVQNDVFSVKRIYDPTKELFWTQVELHDLSRVEQIHLEDPSILQLRKQATDERILIITENMTVTLREFLKSKLQDDSIIEVLQSMVSFVRCLHENRISNFLLSLDNFLVNTTSQKLAIKALPLKLSGAVYISPERLARRDKINAMKEDIFQLGCLFFEIISGESLYESEGVKQLTVYCKAFWMKEESTILISKLYHTKQLKPQLDLADLMKKMVQFEPETRPPIQEIRDQLFQMTKNITLESIIQFPKIQEERIDIDKKNKKQLDPIESIANKRVEVKVQREQQFDKKFDQSNMAIESTDTTNRPVFQSSIFPLKADSLEQGKREERSMQIIEEENIISLEKTLKVESKLLENSSNDSKEASQIVGNIKDNVNSSKSVDGALVMGRHQRIPVKIQIDIEEQWQRSHLEKKGHSKNLQTKGLLQPSGKKADQTYNSPIQIKRNHQIVQFDVLKKRDLSFSDYDKQRQFLLQDQTKYAHIRTLVKEEADQLVNQRIRSSEHKQISIQSTELMGSSEHTHEEFKHSELFERVKRKGSGLSEFNRRISSKVNADSTCSTLSVTRKRGYTHRKEYAHKIINTQTGSDSKVHSPYQRNKSDLIILSNESITPRIHKRELSPFLQGTASARYNSQEANSRFNRSSSNQRVQALPEMSPLSIKVLKSSNETRSHLYHRQQPAKMIHSSETKLKDEMINKYCFKIRSMSQNIRKRLEERRDTHLFKAVSSEDKSNVKIICKKLLREDHDKVSDHIIPPQILVHRVQMQPSNQRQDE